MTNFLDQINDGIIMYDGIIGLFAVSATILLAGLFFWQSRKQFDVESARLLWEFLDRLQENDFRAANKAIKSNNPRNGLIVYSYNGKQTVQHYNTLVPRFFNHFDRMAIFKQQKVVSLEQIEKMYGAYLRNIRDSTEAQLCIDERQKEYPEDFKSLQKLLKKIS